MVMRVASNDDLFWSEHSKKLNEENAAKIDLKSDYFLKSIIENMEGI